MFAIVICLVLIMCTLKFCVVCIDGRRYVCCSVCNVVSNACNEPSSCLVQPIGSHCCEVMYFGCFDSVYVDLQHDEISLTFTAGSVSLCCVCGHMVVFGLSVSLWMR